MLLLSFQSSVVAHHRFQRSSVQVARSSASIPWNLSDNSLQRIKRRCKRHLHQVKKGFQGPKTYITCPDIMCSSQLSPSFKLLSALSMRENFLNLILSKQQNQIIDNKFTLKLYYTPHNPKSGSLSWTIQRILQFLHLTCPHIHDHPYLSPIVPIQYVTYKVLINAHLHYITLAKFSNWIKNHVHMSIDSIRA